MTEVRDPGSVINNGGNSNILSIWPGAKGFTLLQPMQPMELLAARMVFAVNFFEALTSNMGVNLRSRQVTVTQQ